MANGTEVNEETATFYKKCMEKEEYDSIEVYDEYAEKYDKGSEAIQRKTHIYMSEVVRNLLGNDTDVNVLDVACGTGIMGEQLRSLGFTRIDGVDASPKMAEVAAKKCVYGQVLLSAITDQPIESIDSGSYDIVTLCSSFGRNHVRPNSFEELRRILKEGGYIVLSKYTDEAVAEEVVELEEVLERYYKAGIFQLVSCNSYTDLKFGKIPGNIYVLKVLKTRR